VEPSGDDAVVKRLQAATVLYVGLDIQDKRDPGPAHTGLAESRLSRSIAVLEVESRGPTWRIATPRY
jgi:hypothetical protein